MIRELKSVYFDESLLTTLKEPTDAQERLKERYASLVQMELEKEDEWNVVSRAAFNSVRASESDSSLNMNDIPTDLLGADSGSAPDEFLFPELNASLTEINPSLHELNASLTEINAPLPEELMMSNSEVVVQPPFPLQCPVCCTRVSNQHPKIHK